ncbi:MAG: response regulator, partial [Gammaproteobacteria bacterium]
MTASDLPDPSSEAGAEREQSAAIPGPQSLSHPPSHLRHELCTPINHIIGYSELLLEEAEDSALKPFSRDLQKVHTAGKTLLEMINTLFDARKVTAGYASPAAPPTDDPARLHDEDTNTEVGTDEREAITLLPGHLLVVDDNETNRDMLSRRLLNQGYRVSMAEDGRRALQAVRAQAVDLVLLDV